MELESIGADARVRAHFQQFEAEGLELARVCLAAREVYRVLMQTGEMDGVPAGRLRFEQTLPVVGDWVAVRRVDANLALIEEVLPRKGQFSRRAAGRAAEDQVIAANVDLALIVMGLDGDFNLRRLERYLLLVRRSGAEALVVLNKADLAGDLDAAVAAARGLLRGLEVIAIRAAESVEALRPWVKGRSVALVGSSGAGKSTIMNGLLEAEAAATGAVRECDSRGRHTTTQRMLMVMPGGGVIIDNPGMRELQVWGNEEDLEAVFDDVAELAGQCQFRDCVHGGEPGCAVKAALESGELDQSRWLNFAKLRAELRHRAREEDVLEQMKHKRAVKEIHRVMRRSKKW